MTEPVIISIPFDEQTAHAVLVAPNSDPGAALAALDLPPYNGVIVVHGGAGGMDQALIDAVRRFLVSSLAPFAEQRRILVVDGATQVGFPVAMGDARREIGGTFPLLGITPDRFAAYPGKRAPRRGEPEQYSLNPSHSHFILVEGDSFGVESELMVGLLQASGQPGLALIVNGGDIVLEEVQHHAAAGNTLVTVRGSGRVADELADPNSAARAALPSDTRLEIANLQAPDIFSGLLERLLG